jgi:pilus assembly protein CpaD
MQPQNRTLTARLFLVVGMLTLAGCDTTSPDPAEISDARPPKQNRVEFVTLDHDINFARGTRTVAAGEVAGLSNFLRDNAVGSGDTVTVDSAKEASSLAAARQAAVFAELKALHIHAAPAPATTQVANAVRIHVAHAVVTAPQCPDWSKPEADDSDNSPSSNFGCATEANLAAMVANPADLAKGRSSATADGAVLARGVELYRSGNLSKSLSGNSGYSTGGLSGTGGPAASGSGGGGQ